MCGKIHGRAICVGGWGDEEVCELKCVHFSFFFLSSFTIFKIFFTTEIRVKPHTIEYDSESKVVTQIKNMKNILFSVIFFFLFIYLECKSSRHGKSSSSSSLYLHE